MRELTHEQKVDYEYLGLDPYSTKIINPFEKRTKDDVENPHIHLLKVLRNPDYFFLTCKLLFRGPGGKPMTLFPFQSALLRDMWCRPFPMLIASRGAGKCIAGDSLVVTNSGFRKIGDLVGDIPPHTPRFAADSNLSLLGENDYNQVEYSWNNGKTPVKKITTRNGYELSMTHNHPIRVVRNGSVEWVDADRVAIGDRVVIDRTPSWFPRTEHVDLGAAYLFGLLVGDASGVRDFPACIMRAPRDSMAAFIRGLMDTDGTVGKNSACASFTSKSRNLVKTLQFVLLRFGIVSRFYKKFNKKHARYYFNLSISADNARLFASRIGFGLKRKQDRLVRNCLKKVNHNVDIIPAALIGEDLLSLRDRWADVRPSSGHAYNYQRRLMAPYRIKAYDATYPYVQKVLDITESISYSPEWQRLKTILDQNYFYDQIVRIEDTEDVTYDVHMWNDDDRSFISNGFVSHNSFLLGLYSVLRATLIPGRKIVITGSGFRQAKTVFNYSETIWHNSPVLRSLANENPRSGPHHDADRWTLRIGDSTITALPLGDGSRIRGERAHDVLIDEFATCPWEIYETVVRGFGVVELDPVDKVRRKAEIRVLMREGKWNEKLQEEERLRTLGNQSIISGTAYYQFNHFAEYWRRWKGIIESQGDRKKLELVFPNGVSDKFDYRDYAVYRLPLELLPEGFMDEKQIENSRATQHTSIFMNEFSACVLPDEPVITDHGVKRMVDVKVGDRVLTHRGRFRPVTGLTSRPSPGRVVRYRTLGYGRDVCVTEDHPFWQGYDNWDILGDTTRLADLQELNGSVELDIRPIVRAYMENEAGEIYARAGSAKLTRAQVNRIHEYEGPLPSLASSMDLPVSVVYRVRYAKRRGVHAIPPIIPLDRNLGLIVGYYAAEGSIGSGGKAINFALDGHVGISLERYVEQLRTALTTVFSITPKVYRHSDNVARVVATNCLVADVLSWACPGLCDTKYIRPDIMWSNPEFLLGFLEGYWNGDRTSPLASSNSISLAAQIKVACSFLGISASIGYLPEREMVIRGKSYKAAASYPIRLTGEHARRFRRRIYRQEVAPGVRRGQIINDGYASIMPVVSKEIVPYDGLVYNLHVADDESYSLLNATVHNCFSNDSNGFFKRSLIETCVVKTPVVVDGEAVQFRAVTRGNPNAHYVYGIDPASEHDRFSIVILEVYPSHRRVVYCWTTNRQQHKTRLQAGATRVSDFYGYCARKIRDLMKSFSCEHIALDSQGGGVAVSEALHDHDKAEKGEPLIWPVTSDHPLSNGKENESDRYPGLHIIEMVNFASADWVSEANHGMRKDFEDRVLLFPHYDTGVLAIAMEDDAHNNRTFDTLEDAAEEVEEIKEELATIVHTQTPNSFRDRWDTPEIKQAGNKKGRLRKDRYSALLMANSAARRLSRQYEIPDMSPMGGFVQSTYVEPVPASAKMYVAAPNWFMKQIEGGYDQFGWVKRPGVTDRED